MVSALACGSVHNYATMQPGPIRIEVVIIDIPGAKFYMHSFECTETE